jgi:hypothetical protein
MDDHAKLSRDLVQVDEDGREWYSLRNAPAFLISSQLSDDWIYAAQAVLVSDGMLDGVQLSTADVACRRFECERELIRRLADGDLEARGFDARSFSSDPEIIERLRWLSFTSVDFDAGIASDGITAISGIMVSRFAAQRPSRPAEDSSYLRSRRPKLVSLYMDSARARVSSQSR